MYYIVNPGYRVRPLNNPEVLRSPPSVSTKQIIMYEDYTTYNPRLANHINTTTGERYTW